MSQVRRPRVGRCRMFLVAVCAMLISSCGSPADPSATHSIPTATPSPTGAPNSRADGPLETSAAGTTSADSTVATRAVESTQTAALEQTVLEVVATGEVGKVSAYGGLTVPDFETVPMQTVLDATDLAAIATVVEIAAPEANTAGREKSIQVDQLKGDGPLLVVPTTWISFRIDSVLGRRTNSQLPKLERGETISLPLPGGAIALHGTKATLAAAGIAPEVFSGREEDPTDVVYSQSALISLSVGDSVVLPIGYSDYYLVRRVGGEPASEQIPVIAYTIQGLVKIVNQTDLESSEYVEGTPRTIDETTAFWSQLDKL